MLVKRLNEYVELPTRGSKWSAGLDLYCPFDITVPADAQRKIPLGIAVQIPDFMLVYWFLVVACIRHHYEWQIAWE